MAPGEEGSPTSENLQLSESTPAIRLAIGLLDDTFAVLASPERWCQGAWARDGAGQPIGGSILVAVESEQAACRCLLGELLHQGLARGYRIEIAVEPGEQQQPSEVTRAPASWLLAADALAHMALSLIAERELWRDEPRPSGEPPPRRISRGERALASVYLNELGTYQDAVWTAVVLAAQNLRIILDRRTQQER